MTDYTGQARRKTILAYGTDMADQEVLLGRHTLKHYAIDILNGQDAWKWGYVKEDMDFISAEALARMLKRDKKQLVRYVSWIRVKRTADGPLKVHVTEAAVDPRIPDALHAYRDLFNNEAANRKEPPYGPLYPLSAREQEVLREYLKKELAAGRIEHSISPAGAPLLFVPKADSDLRLCVDYRALNNYFTSLDLKDAYYRIRIREGDEWKTAFPTFQAYINRALLGLLDDICVVYLDDILVYTHSDSLKEH
ncbi:Concanavalin A-like lectin/glucanase [Teratosphaeria destructans]|uniref:Concanavalin A-like lectin/glucanase n=1 Tax=Teratosphaeria destructans TaxID=418781 RepID=A0A9W7SQI2_9PEZI|nr:Concanavalin A-like lectin/glucanase [Teratosphaeria destructans]